VITITNIGVPLKECRNKLGVTQKEIASKFISRNHLSEIENNNVALTPKNAIHLCYQLQYFSALKNIKVPFIFDDIIQESEFNSEYHLIKSAMAYNDSVLLAIKKTEPVNNYSSMKEVYQKINHNLLRACLYHNLGDSLGIHRNYKEQLDTYLKSFDAVRVENEITMLCELFDKITPLMFRLALYEEFVTLAHSFINELKSKDKSIHPKIYLNMSLAYSHCYKLTESLECIELFLNNSDYTSIYYPQALLMKANDFSMLNKFDIAKDLYIQSSTIFLERKEYDSYYLTLSNIIDLLIAQGEITESPNSINSISDSVRYYISDIEAKISKSTINPITLAKIYTNVAKGYSFLGEYETAISYYENVFRMDLQSDSITHYFKAIEISIPCFTKVGKLKYLYETYVKYGHLPAINWNKQLKLIYEEVLLKIGVNLIDCSDNILQEIFKSLIIIKDYDKKLYG